MESANISSRPIAYLAGPFGFSEAGRDFYTTKLIPLVENAGFFVLDPWKLTDPQTLDRARSLPFGAERRTAWSKVNAIIAENNTRAIMGAHILVAVLDGADVDSGTAAEIGYASALGKVIIGYRGDFRLSADNEGSIVNLQVEHFILKSGGTIARNTAALARVLALHAERAAAERDGGVGKPLF